MRTLAAVLLLLAACLWPPHAKALGGGDHRGVCADAGARAAERHGVPEALLAAIALTETGRPGPAGVLEAWPWAMNVAGESRWHARRAAAAKDAAALLARGQRNFDIGCFQVNHRWHGEGFASLAEMLEPVSNADYAARFLAALYRESGNWMVAAGHYHSRTPTLATAYRARVAGHLRRAGVALADLPQLARAAPRRARQTDPAGREQTPRIWPAVGVVTAFATQQGARVPHASVRRIGGSVGGLARPAAADGTDASRWRHADALGRARGSLFVPAAAGTPRPLLRRARAPIVGSQPSAPPFAHSPSVGG